VLSSRVFPHCIQLLLSWYSSSSISCPLTVIFFSSIYSIADNFFLELGWIKNIPSGTYARKIVLEFGDIFTYFQSSQHFAKDKRKFLEIRRTVNEMKITLH
jgi:hypothetical protein